MEKQIKLKENIEPRFLEQLGYENNLSDEHHLFETYEKHINKFTNVLVFVDNKQIEIRYDDDFGYYWYDFEEMMREDEIKFLLKNNYADIIIKK